MKKHFFFVHRVLSVFAVVVVASVGMTASAQDGQVHVVRSGDTLFGISRQYDVSVDRLKCMNNLTDNRINVGQRIWIEVPAPANYEAAARTAASVRIEQGEADLDPEPEIPLADEAEMADATPDVDPPSNPFVAGDSDNGDVVSSVVVPDDPEALARSFDYHIAQEGETLYSIGFAYGVPVDSLWLINDEILEPLAPGDTVWIPLDPTMSLYHVEQGDTIEQIATWFEISVDRIRRANGLKGQPQAGQTIRIPSDDADLTDAPVVFEQTGEVRMYPDRFEGRLMANGRPYEQERYSISHATLPLGTIVILSNTTTGRSTFAVVTDRVPPNASYMSDMSKAVGDVLRLDTSDNALVHLRAVDQTRR